MSLFKTWVIAALLVLCGGICVVSLAAFGVASYQSDRSTPQPTRIHPQDLGNMALHSFESSMKKLHCDYQIDRTEMEDLGPNGNPETLARKNQINVIISYRVRSGPDEPYINDVASYSFIDGVPLPGQDPVNCR